MNTPISKQFNRAVTLLDLLAGIAVLAIAAMVLVPSLLREKAKAKRIHCTDNLKEISRAFRLWSADHDDKYPMSVSQTYGGSLEFTTGPNAFHHFQIISNQLNSSKFIFCPAESDRTRASASNINVLNNSNLSYFVGVDANGTNTMFLVGDRNFTNGTSLKNSVLELATNNPAGWTAQMHGKIGNIGLADESVLQLNTFYLQKAVSDAGLPTNRLQMPIFAP